MEVWPPGLPLCTILRPGTRLIASGAERSCCCSNCCELITVTELATLAAGVATAVGLTTTGSFAAVGGAVVVRGAGVEGRETVRRGGAGSLTLTSRRSTAGEAVCCATAGTAQSGSTIEVRAVDASQPNRRAPREGAGGGKGMGRDTGARTVG